MESYGGSYWMDRPPDISYIHELLWQWTLGFYARKFITWWRKWLCWGSDINRNQRYVDAFLDYANCGYVSWTLGLFDHKKVKGNAVPLHAWSGPEGSRKLRLPDFMTTAHDGGKVVSLTNRPPLPLEIHLVLISVRGCVDPRAKVRPAGLCHWKIPMTPSRIETRDTPVCSVMP